MPATNDSTDRTRCIPLVITATFVAGSLAYSLHAASFLHPKAAVFTLGAAVLLLMAHPAHAGRLWTGAMAFLPLWLYLAFGALRALLGLSPAGSHTAAAFFMLAPSLLFASLARPFLTEDLVRRTLLWGTAPVAAMALAQYSGWIDGLLPPVPTYTQAMYSVFGNQDLLGGFVALGLVAAVQGVLRREPHPVLWMAALAMLLPAWLLAGSRTAWLAGVLGLAVSLLCMASVPGKRLAWLGLAGALAVVIIAALSPMATLERITGTFAPGDEGGWFRLWFWDGTLRMIAGAPFFGVGLGVFEYEAPRFLGQAYAHSEWIQHKATELTVNHAHSDPLEALAEMGLFGAVLLGWMAWRLRAGRGEAWGPLTVLLVFACFNATAISPPHAVAGLLLMGCLMPMPAGEPEPSRWKTAPIVLFTAWLAVTMPYCLLIPSIQLRTAQTAHLAGAGSPARYERIRPCAAMFPEAQTSLAQWHVEQEDWEAAIRAYERALPDTGAGGIHLELGALYYRMGNLEQAREHLEAAVERWPWNYDAWRLLIAALPPAEQAAALEQARAWVPPDDAARLEALFTP